MWRGCSGKGRNRSGILWICGALQRVIPRWIVLNYGGFAWMGSKDLWNSLGESQDALIMEDRRLLRLNA